MKLYDGGRAPNPRRVRVFLAEKGISVPLEQVDLGALAQKSPAFAAINPMQRVPALVLDDGTVIAESIAICRYFEALQPGAAAVRARRAGKRGDRDVESAARTAPPVSDLARVPQQPSGDGEDGNPAGAGLGGGQQAAHRGVSWDFRSRACEPAVRRRRPLQRCRHHRHDRHRLHEAGEACGAGGVRQCAPLARRRCRRGRARVPDHAAHHRRLRRRLRLRRPLQHLLLAQDREGDAAGRLRRVLAGGAQGARARPRRCRRHRPLASARRPFRRAAVPAARRATRDAARASAHHRRAARLAGADRGGDRECSFRAR